MTQNNLQLSRLESEAYKTLKSNNLRLFKIKDLCILLKMKEIKAYNLIKSLKKKGVIRKFGGFFVIKDTDELVIGTRLVYPSYISFWSALNYYGFSDNNPRKIFIASTTYSKEINNFKYVKFSSRKFFGYALIGEIVIAEKEKAIIDSLLFPKYSGGIKEIEKCIKAALPLLDMRKLLDYAFQIKSKAVLRRLGFILEILNYDKNYLEKIKKKIGKGYELLDPSQKRQNNLNSKWLLDVNK